MKLTIKTSNDEILESLMEMAHKYARKTGWKGFTEHTSKVLGWAFYRSPWHIEDVRFFYFSFNG